MDDRQRQFAQLASAINQFAGNGDRGSRERSAPDGRSSTGSTSSGSSNSSGNAAAAALWGDIGRAFTFNYSGFPSGSGWPSHQGGSDFHRYGGYSGFTEGSLDNRNIMEGRSEGRRVPSKGETKATPPLPTGLTPGMGSALASLQQLVALPNDDAYRSLIAQQYAAAAAFSALAPTTHASLSPIPSVSHSTVSPSQLHTAASSVSSRHQQQQIDKHIQQQYHMQMSRQRQQSKSPPMLPLMSTLPASSNPSAMSPENSLNGEYLEAIGRPQSSHLASRKEHLLDQQSTVSYQAMRPSPNPTPPKSTSVSPIDRITPSQIAEQEHHYNSYEGEKIHGISMRAADTGARSGSESDGDQKIRHKRKQDQPRRQSVIYSNTLHSLQLSGIPSQHIPSSMSAESSSDDSQGYDSLITHPSANDSMRNSSPLLPIATDPMSAPSSVSQAMSHALSHPFLAAHLNNSYPDHKHSKSELPPPQYRDDFASVSSVSSSHFRDNISAYNPMKDKFALSHYRSDKVNSLYTSKDLQSAASYYRNEKDMYDPRDLQDRSTYMHQAHPDAKNHYPRNSPHGVVEYGPKMSSFPAESEVPTSLGINRNINIHNSQYCSDGSMYYQNPAATASHSNYRFENHEMSGSQLCENVPNSLSADSQFVSSDGNVLNDQNDDRDKAVNREQKVSKFEESESLLLQPQKTPEDRSVIDRNDDKLENFSNNISDEQSLKTQYENSVAVPSDNQKNIVEPVSNTDLDTTVSVNSECHREKGMEAQGSTVSSIHEKVAVEQTSEILSDANVGVCDGSDAPQDQVSEQLMADAASSEDSSVKHKPESETVINGVGSHTVENSKEEEEAKKDDTSVKKDDDTENNKITQIESAELLNGDHDHITSQAKRNKRKLENEISDLALLPDLFENKRRTRQKRPVSYVEDETDPVLEMNEDTPLLSPAKKRGRRSKDKIEVDRLSADSGLLSPPPLAKEGRNMVYEMSPSHINHGFSQKEKGTELSWQRDSHFRSRILDGSRIPSNLSEPLHIDTSISFSKNDFDIPGPTPITPVLHSPDIYDFNDMDGEGGIIGTKKRGRKRGSPKKPGRTITPEFLRLSPRIRENVFNRSPKFFTNTRNQENSDKLHAGYDSAGIEMPFRTIPDKVSEADPVLNNPVPAPPPLLLPNSSSIVDEVEMQLAALHKEHIAAEAESRRIGTPDRVPSAAERKQKGNELSNNNNNNNSPVVHKPLLSVVPLEQLTYEGLRKKNIASKESVKKDEIFSVKIGVCSESLKSHTSSVYSPNVDSSLLLGDHNLSSRYNHTGAERDTNPLSPALSFTHIEEKSEIDLSENIHIYNENFDSESENSVIVTKKILSRGRKRNDRKELQVFDEGSSLPSFANKNEKLFNDKVSSCDFNTAVESHLLDNVMANIVHNRPNVQVVSVAEVPSPSFASGKSNRGNRYRKRGGRNRNSNQSAREEEIVVEESESVNSSALHSSSDNNVNNIINDDIFSENPPRLRRSRRSTNSRIEADASPTSSPPPLNSFSSPDDNAVGSQAISSGSTSDNLCPPSQVGSEIELKKQDANFSQDGLNENCTQASAGTNNEAETLEDIAKFLEDTAPSYECKTPTSSKKSQTPPSSSDNSKLVDGTELSYKDTRPKRVSRPPPDVNDGETNDLLLLLNMEDEESDDEDYVPKLSGHERTTLDSGNADVESETNNCKVRESKHQNSSASSGKEAVTGKSTSRKKKEEASKNRKLPAKPSKVVKGKLSKCKDNPHHPKRKDDTKKKWEYKYDQRGPILRYSQDDGTDVIVNTPNRDDEEQDKNKKLNSPFYVDTKSAKVGFNSTLHNNYDAFNKDLSWFCAFCKNYSHFRTLGDLFGPFYIRGLNLKKKNFPEVIEGQVPEVALSPTPCTSVDTGTGSKPRNKRTPKHESNDSLSEAKKQEMGSSSPPVRFIPAATPARMLGRGGTTPRRESNGGMSSPRIPGSSPKRVSSGTNNNSLQSCSEPLDVKSEQSHSSEGTECWLHEACLLWSSGVTVINSKLCGIEEAILAAQESVCHHCGETGATVCCLGKSCSVVVHVPCARLLLWTLDTLTFQSFCPKHVVSKGCTNPKGKSPKKS